MVSELWFGGGLNFDSPSPPIFSQFNMDTKTLIALEMGARDPLFNPRVNLQLKASAGLLFT